MTCCWIIQVFLNQLQDLSCGEASWKGLPGGTVINSPPTNEEDARDKGLISGSG